MIRKFIIDYNQDVQMNVLTAIVQKPRPVNEQRITQGMGLFVCWKCKPQTHCDLNYVLYLAYGMEMMVG